MALLYIVCPIYSSEKYIFPSRTHHTQQVSVREHFPGERRREDSLIVPGRELSNGLLKA